MPQHQLLLGDFVLAGTNPDASAFWTVSALADDASTGSPDPVLSTVRGLLQDGAVVTVDGWENRTAVFRLRIDAKTSADLEAAEAALVAQVGIRNTLTWVPPDGLGHATVFDVVTSRLDHDFDDLLELDQRRMFRLELTCSPFPRSADEQVVTAVAPATTDSTVTIDDASSTSGWSADATGTSLSGSGGVVRATRTSSTGRQAAVSLTRSGAVSMTGTPYLVVRVTCRAGDIPTLKFLVGGVEAQLVAAMPYTTVNSYTTRDYVIMQATPADFSSFTARVTGAPVGAYIEVDYLKRTNTIPSFGTTRQRLWTLDVPGSVRSPGTLEVVAGDLTQSLGQVILYTCPASYEGYIPSLSPYETSLSGRVNQSNLVTGTYESITSATRSFDVPAASLPRGLYALMARLWVTSGNPATQSVAWTAQVVVAGVPVGPLRSGTTTITFTTTGNYELFTLAALDLPIMDLPDATSAVVRITLANGGLTANTIRLDEAWVFNLDGGDLTVVDCGTALAGPGGAASRVWSQPPATDRPYPSLLIGSSVDMSDAYHPGLAAASVAVHTFDPPSTQVFTVTSNSLNATVRWRGYPRWYHYAAQ